MAARATLKHVRGTCDQYKQSLLARRVVNAEEMEKAEPSGKERRDLMAWIRFYGQLRVWLSRTSEAERAAARAERKKELLDALAEVPERVELSGGKVVHVYQKNDLALRVAHVRTLQAAMLVDGVRTILEHGLTPEDAELVERAHIELNYHQSLIAWIYCSSGGRLPFPLTWERPEVPQEYADLASPDFHLIAAAAQRVNVGRLQCIDTKGGSRMAPDWPAYWSGLHAELGTATADLLGGDQSVVALVIASAERARAEKEAMERAKKKNAVEPKRVRSATA